MIEGFLLGIIVACSFIAGGYFAKFWRATRDPLFLGFAVAFILEGINRSAFLFLSQPNVGSEPIYLVRLVSYAIILGVIAYKNRQ